MYQKDGPKAVKKGLDNIIELCEVLHQPQDAYPTIHIAGTNGKGSVTHMMASVLQAAGLTVGLYTSPHYKDFRERIKINGLLIPKRAVRSFLNKHRAGIDRVIPTFFELSVAMAFDYFKANHVDIAIIETGMGGRLDSTNIITPILSVITNISFDHQASLGHTLAKIAAEKAGIIKPNVSVVIGEKKKETQSVFINKAKSMGSPIIWVSDTIRLSQLVLEKSSMRCTYQYMDHPPSEVRLDLIGLYQLDNLKTALVSLEQLRDVLDLSQSDFSLGLSSLKKRTRFIGRFQVLSDHPWMIADAAHNAAGLRALMSSLADKDPARAHIVLGMVREKDPVDLLRGLPKQARYYFCTPNVPRGMPVTDLRRHSQRIGLRGKSYTTVRRALAAAKRQLKSDLDFILITGSSYVVAEVV